MYDVIIIGGGPAGVTAALRARELGASTALVERGRLGGTCTNDGCAPTRVLARTARLAREAQQFAEYGLEGPLPTLNFAEVMERTQAVIYRLQEKKQLISHLESVGVTTLRGVGNAAFVDPHTLRLPNGQMLEAERFVLCVGGSPRRLNFPGSEHTLTHSDVWSMRRLPASVVVVGSGATGCQLASIFEAFGSSVTLLDVAPRILIAEDAQVAATMRQEFERAGIRVITGSTGVERVEKSDDGYLVHTQVEGQALAIAAEAVIMAVGWPGNVSSLNLPAAGVHSERSYIVVNDYLQTTAPHIYAAGDITGKMMLVQSAGSQARVAVENALMQTPGIPIVHRLVPHGGFTDPEYGSVGLTEEQARQQGEAVVATVPYADLDRAVIDDRTAGFCKLIVDPRTRLILGGHVVGEQAVEVVQLLAAGMAAGMRIEQLADLELAYPTYTAIVGLAARELVRLLGLIPMSQEWVTLRSIRGSEWERYEGG
ncbi:NAD(P)/FAD-dependent oxidoreductase [Anaerolineae bacterium CFX9]|nr:NAD(P)/FAD-dependent oxidoreductase [Anaerolineae bacterium CFX9]